MAARSQTLQGLDILQNGVQNQEIDIPRNDQYVEEQNISNENWRTNCYEYRKIYCLFFCKIVSYILTFKTL